MEKIKNFFKKLKPNRAVYITAVTLLVSLALIIAITVAANRSKKRGEESNTTSGISTNLPETTHRPITQAPETTTAPGSSTDTDKPTSADEPLTLALPVSGSLSAYHDEDVQVWSDTMRDYRVHLGIDIATEANAPVYAAADGVVSQVWEDVKMGYCVSIKHGEDTYTVYRNLAENQIEGIREGVSVKAGQLIGNVGNSAMIEIAEDPHLHLEMTVGGKQVNPLDYFDATAIASLNVDTRYEG